MDTLPLHYPTIVGTPDLQASFDAAPGSHLVSLLTSQSLPLNEAYRRATMTRDESIVGRQLFEVFPGEVVSSVAS